MTGRQMIIFIMTNHLEDKNVFDNGVLAGFISEKELADKFEVGVETIRTWKILGLINGVTIGDHVCYLPDTSDPRYLLNKEINNE